MARNRKNCLLIQPPTSLEQIRGRWFSTTEYALPIGLLSIASYLIKHGYPTYILPMDYYISNRETPDWDEMTKSIERYMEDIEPSVIGVTGFTYQYPLAKEIIRMSKEIDSKVITVAGGPHFTFTAEESLMDIRDLDVVLRGEGEWVMVEILDRIGRGEGLSDVHGISFRSKDVVIHNPPRPPGNLESLPPLDYGLLPYRFYSLALIDIVWSRGCPYGCAYCVESEFWGHRMRFEKAENVVKNYIELSKCVDIKSNAIGFGGSFVYGDTPFFKRVASLIERVDEDRHFWVFARAERITDEAVRNLKRAGVKVVCFGVESGSDRVAGIMGRSLTFDRIVDACKMVRDHDIDVGTFWFFGFPGDTPEDAEVSLEKMQHLWEKDLHQFQESFIFVPYPGTGVFRNPDRYGVQLITRDYGRYLRQGRPVFESRTFPAERIAEFYRRAKEIEDTWYNLYRYIPYEASGRPKDH